MFQFLDFDCLTDNEIDLHINKKIPANEEKGFVPAYQYDITLHDNAAKIGSIELRIGDTDDLVKYAGHIGYEIFPDFRGEKYAAKTCRVISRVFVAHGMERVIITCNPDNWASRRTCEIAGARLLEIVDLPEDNDMHLDGDRQKCRYEWKL